MSSMRMIDAIKESGGEVVHFQSLGGGLPAPEAANNPLKYKFSWSPRGAIRASQNAAKFRRNGTVVEIDGRDLLQSAEAAPAIVESLSLEQLPNRDSLKYGTLYSIESAKTVFRGTLRYAGWSSIMHAFSRLGLTQSSRVSDANYDQPLPETWPELMERVHAESGILPEEVPDDAAACLRWLGVYDRGHSVESGANTVLDAFCCLLESRLAFAHGERDMIVMHHNILAQFSDHSERHIFIHRFW